MSPPTKNVPIRTDEELLVHVLLEHFASFFNNHQAPEPYFHEEYVLPLEILLIATLYPGYLQACKLRVENGRITSKTLADINTRLIGQGYVTVNQAKISVMPLRLYERHLFPRLEPEKVQHYLAVLIKSCFSYQEEINVVHPILSFIESEQSQFRIFLEYLMIISVVYTHNYQRRHVKGPAILEMNAIATSEILTGVERLFEALKEFYEPELAKLFIKKYFLAQKIIVQHFKITESRFEVTRTFSSSNASPKLQIPSKFENQSNNSSTNVLDLLDTTYV